MCVNVKVTGLKVNVQEVEIVKAYDFEFQRSKAADSAQKIDEEESAGRVDEC